MRVHVRISVLALLVGAAVVFLAPAAAQAAFGVEEHGWFASNCKEPFEACGKKAVEENKEPTEAEAVEQGYTQAAGHPPFGITHFKLRNHQIQVSPFPAFAPDENLKNLRVDVAPGVSTNPEAVTKCTVANFKGTEVEVAGQHVFTSPNCPESEIGENTVTTLVPTATPGVFADVTLKGKVYNLEQEEGQSSLFGVALSLKPLFGAEVFAHTFIKGNVEWGAQPDGTGQADYHDYFLIKEITPGLLSSRLVFFGNKGNTGKGAFLSNPTSCTGIGPQTTTHWRGESDKGVVATAAYTTPIGTELCGPLVPFAPGFALGAETTKSDANDGITAEVTLPHDPNPANLDSSDLKTAAVTLPEGMTLNPSAAQGLTACTPAQARIHSETPGVGCLESSKIGTVELNVPGLPPGSLKGNIYLGGPESGPITSPPYVIYLDAESKHYGVSVRIKGEAVPNPTTGQVTTTFSENPEQPFSQAILHFNGGNLAPIANPLSCGAATATTLMTPFTAGVAATSPSSGFAIDSNGSGGACSSPLPFAPAQSTSNQTATAGAKTSFTFALERPEGNQYLKKVQTVLPAGLVGLIPAVEQCAEAQANAGRCSPASQIGEVVATVGSGPTPLTVPTGKVYLTGPYQGAPFGMSIVVPNVAGPFNLGQTVTRAAINVNQENARVSVSSELPTIIQGGIVIRMRKLVVSINKQGFLQNPTFCGGLATESSVTGITGTTLGSPVALSTPFQVGNCTALAFKPSFKAKSGGKTSKKIGASLETTLNLPSGGSNVKSVLVTLPAALPSRLTTLQKACPEATFKANPFNCPSGSFVGGVRANTPTLPAKMKGPAILVSHGGAAFPDLDLVLEGNGVRVVLVGNTDIKKGITTTNFASTPDVPVTSITVNLPVGPHSALATFRNLCTTSLVMPTVITGQNGSVTKQKTKIGVTGCGVQIVGHKVIGNAAFITVKTFAAGRISGKGAGLATVFRSLRGASNATRLRVPIARGHHPHKVRLRVGFVPKNRKLGTSAAFVTVSFH
jgi:hypothetical protein